MSLTNVRTLPKRTGYSLELQHPRSGATTIETYASLPALITRAGQAMQAGYRIGIWSPIALERRKRPQRRVRLRRIHQ